MKSCGLSATNGNTDESGYVTFAKKTKVFFFSFFYNVLSCRWKVNYSTEVAYVSSGVFYYRYHKLEANKHWRLELSLVVSVMIHYTSLNSVKERGFSFWLLLMRSLNVF